MGTRKASATQDRPTVDAHDNGQKMAASGVLLYLADETERTHGEATHCEKLRRWARGVEDNMIAPADIPHLLRRPNWPAPMRPACERAAAILAGELTVNPPMTSRVSLFALNEGDVIRFDEDPCRHTVKSITWVPGLNAYQINLCHRGDCTFFASDAPIVTRYDRQELTAMTVVKSSRKFAVSSGQPYYLEDNVTKTAAQAWIANAVAGRAEMWKFHHDREERIAAAGWVPCAPHNLRPGDHFTSQRPNGDLEPAHTVARVVMNPKADGSGMVHFAEGGFHLVGLGMRTFARPAVDMSAGDLWADIENEVYA